jgi:hypothetical protein
LSGFGHGDRADRRFALTDPLNNVFKEARNVAREAIGDCGCAA